MTRSDERAARPSGRTPNGRPLLLATDSTNYFAIVPRPLPQAVARLAPGQSVIDSSELLVAEPIPARAMEQLLWPFHPSAVADPAAQVLLGVRRAVSPEVQLAGQIEAIRGAARLQTAVGDALICRNMIEVYFHRTRQEDSKAPEELPALDSTAWGQAVISAYGGAIGIIVGGREDRAIVCPVGPFLSQHGLQLIDRLTFDNRHAEIQRQDSLGRQVTSLFEDFATTPPYPYGDPLEPLR